MRSLKSIAVVVACVLLSACETLHYYSQAAEGQLSIWWRRQPIESLLDDPATDAKLKRRLQLVEEIRSFASSNLGLPDNDSFRYYTDLQRSHVVWNVFAAPEFSVEPLRWCFPVAGCVSYRGYFARGDAELFADKLKRQGLDTYVGGVAAYSTLGWFNDPLLNTFLHYDDVHLAGLIFHELAHQQLYVPGDTTFNESFATSVQNAGVQRWLESRGNAALMQQYLREQAFQRDFVETLLTLRQRLAVLYASDLAAPQMRRQKQVLLDDFVTGDYAAFKKRWGGSGAYDKWVGSGLNNASLNTVSSYNRWLSAFGNLLAQSGDNFSEFYRRAGQLAEMKPERRREQLLQLDALGK